MLRSVLIQISNVLEGIFARLDIEVLFAKNVIMRTVMCAATINLHVFLVVIA